MLSSILRSKRAIQVNVQIMRTFVRLRQMIASQVSLARRLDELEKKYDTQFRVVFDAIRQLMAAPEPKEKKIGFRAREREARYNVLRRKSALMDAGASVTGSVQQG